MGLIEDEGYRVFIITPQIQHKSHRMNMARAIEFVAIYLNNIQAIDCLDKGKWLATASPLTGEEIFWKRYIIEISVPYTKIMIKKETKGSIDDKIFTKLLKNIKEQYNEGI